MKREFGCLIKFVFVIIVFIIGSAFGYFYALGRVEEELNKDTHLENTGAPTIGPSNATTRDATTGDLEHTDFIFSDDCQSVTFRFVPKTDIDDLKIKMELYDSTEFLLDSQIVTIGNVIAGQQYSTTVSLPENIITQGKYIKTANAYVQNGIVEL